MNKFIRIKNIVIVMLCVTVVAMAAGYIVLSLKLENLTVVQPQYSVSFVNIKKLTSIKGGIKEPVGELKIDDTGKIVDMTVVMYAPHDEIDYEITIKNQGNMEASIMDILTSPDFNDSTIMSLYSPVTVSVSSMAGRVLEAGEEATFKVSIFYNSSNNPSELTAKKITAKLGLLTESVIEE